MRKKEEIIDQKVKDTLTVLDDIRRVPGNPYLLTRLEEQLKREATRLNPNQTIASFGRLLTSLTIFTLLLTCLNGWVLWESVSNSTELGQEEVQEMTIGSDSGYLESFF